MTTISLAVGFFFGIALGRFFPYDDIARNLQNDAAKAVLDISVRGTWVCWKIHGLRVFLEGERGNERVMVWSEQAPKIDVGDTLNMKVVSETAYQDLVVDRKELREMFGFHTLTKLRTDGKKVGASA